MALTLDLKHNLNSRRQPTTTDDRNAGYSEGSRWGGNGAGLEWVCIDATPSAARWAVDYSAVTHARAAIRAALRNDGRTGAYENFAKRPFLAADITAFTDSSGGATTTPNTIAEITTGGAAADEGPTQNAIAKIALKINNMLAANEHFEVAGTNMTSALATHNAARGGVRLATAGANNDQSILQPRQTNSGDSLWATGMVTDQSPSWTVSFRLGSVAAISIKVGLALTNAHNLTTDDDQVALWFTTATGGNWLVATSIGGTDATVDTGIAPAANREYRLAIDIDENRVARVWLNGVLVATTDALTTAVNLKPYISIQALTGAAKTIDIRYQDKDMAIAA